MSGQVLRNDTIFDHCVSDKVNVDILLLCHKCQHALVRFSEGNIESAIFNYNAAIDQDPKNSRAYRDRAEAHDKLSNKDKAEQDITKAKEIEAFI